MRQILLFAAIFLIGGGFLARFADRELMSPAADNAKSATVGAAPSDSGGRTMVIPPDARGHFQVDASFNGRRLDFIVDTGASVVVLRQSDAARLGIHPLPRDYNVNVATANGSIKGARAQFNSVEVGGIRVYDVAGLVLPDEALQQNLLGLSFLSRLRRFEFAGGKLILEQ